MGEVLGFPRCERERAVDDLDSLAEIVVLGRDHAEQEQRVRVVRLDSENFYAELVGEAVIAPVHARAPPLYATQLPRRAEGSMFQVKRTPISRGRTICSA